MRHELLQIACEYLCPATMSALVPTSMEAFNGSSFDLVGWLNTALPVPAAAELSSEAYNDDVETNLSAVSVRLQLLCNEFQDVLNQEMSSLAAAWPRVKRDARVIASEAASLSVQLKDVQTQHNASMSHSSFWQQLEKLDVAAGNMEAVRALLSRAAAFDRLLQQGQQLDTWDVPASVEGGDGSLALATSLSKLADYCSALEKCAADLQSFPRADRRAEAVAAAQRSLQAAVHPVLNKALQRNDANGIRAVLTALEKAVGRPERVAEALAHARILPLLVAWAAYGHGAGQAGSPAGRAHGSVLDGSAAGQLTDKDVLSAGVGASAVAVSGALSLVQLARRNQSDQGGHGSGLSGQASGFVRWLSTYYALLGEVLLQDARSVTQWYAQTEADVHATPDGSRRPVEVLGRMARLALGCTGEALHSITPSAREAVGLNMASGSSESSVADSCVPPTLADWRVRLDADGLGSTGNGTGAATGQQLSKQGYAAIGTLLADAERLYACIGQALQLASSAGTSGHTTAATVATTVGTLVYALSRPFAWYALQQPTLEAEMFAAAVDAAVRQASGNAGAAVSAALALPVPSVRETRPSTALTVMRVPGHAGSTSFRRAQTEHDGLDGVLHALESCRGATRAAGRAVLSALGRCHDLTTSAGMPELLEGLSDSLTDLCGRVYSCVTSLHDACTGPILGAVEPGGGSARGGQGGAQKTAPLPPGSAPKGRGGPGASWMDDEPSGATNALTGANQAGAGAVAKRVSLAELHTACVRAWSVASDVLLLLDVIETAAVLYADGDKARLRSAVARATSVSMDQQAAPGQVIDAVLWHMLGCFDATVGSSGSGHSPEAAAAAGLASPNIAHASQARVQAVKAMLALDKGGLSSPVAAQRSPAAAADGSSNASGLAAESAAGEEQDEATVQCIEDSVVAKLKDARAAAQSALVHTYRLTFDAAVAQLGVRIVGLHSSAGWAREQGSSAAQHAALDTDADAAEALDSYSVQASAAVMSLCEGLLDVARAAAPGAHPLVAAARAIDAHGQDSNPAASSSTAVQSAMSACCAVAAPSYPPLALVLASHARAALCMASSTQGNTGTAQTAAGAGSDTTLDGLGVVMAHLGRDEVEAAYRLLGTGIGSCAQPPDTTVDAGVALLCRVAEPLVDGLALANWVRGSMALDSGAGPGSTLDQSAAIATVGPAMATEVAAAMARLWLHALARGACALLAVEIHRLQATPAATAGATGAAAAGPASAAKTSISRDTARHVLSDARYLTTVVRALGSEPHPVLLQAVEKVTGQAME